MILGLGTDIVEVDRIAALIDRHGDRFLERVFRPAELDLARERGAAAAATLAARWAAREALLKALGRPIGGIPYRDVEVVRQAEGPVALRLHGRAERAVAELGAKRVHLSLSHERAYAVATVVLES
jgi:holo-[acyl-carrier protein] synthase